MNISKRNYCKLLINHEQNYRFKNGEFTDDNQKIIEYFFYSPENDIIKKTNKGRKENFCLPEYIPKCEICLEYYNNSKEILVICSICKCFFHKSCYNQYEISFLNNKYIYNCYKCAQALKLNKSIYENDFKCFICGNSNKLLYYNQSNKNYYHLLCLICVSELHNLQDKELERNQIRKWRYKNSCKYCCQKLSKLNAVIKCKKPKCKNYYHIPCAIKKNIIFDLNFMRKFYNVPTNIQIPFFCPNHNKKILNCYKNFILNKVNVEIKKELFNPLLSFEKNNKENESKEKANIYDLYNDNFLSDDIEDEENYFKDKEYTHNLYDDILSISFFDQMKYEENQLKDKEYTHNLYDDIRPISFFDQMKYEENQFKQKEYTHNLCDDIRPISLSESIENEYENFYSLTHNKPLTIDLNGFDELNNHDLYLDFDNILNRSNSKKTKNK